MTQRVRAAVFFVCAAALWPAPPAAAQAAKPPRPWGRVSFMADGVSASDRGTSLPGFTELVTSVTFASPMREAAGTEYRVDFRAATYPGVAARDGRLSVYD